MTRNVGVIGLGVIGLPIAQRLVETGHRVAVYDVRAQPMAQLQAMGAIACRSPAEVAEQSELTVSLVLDRSQTEEVVSGPAGVIHTIKAGSIFAIGSTLGPEPVRAAERTLAAKDCATLDMPITGGYIAAREGSLSLMIGAAPATLERALPVLRAFATVVTRAGDVGAGQVAKLAHQLVLTVNVMALLEGLALGVAGGVDSATLKQILKSGIADSKVLQVWEELGPRWKHMLEATPPDVTPPNLRKDMHSALELAHELGVNLYLATQASLIADAGVATGHNDPGL